MNLPPLFRYVINRLLSQRTLSFLHAAVILCGLKQYLESVSISYGAQIPTIFYLSSPLLLSGNNFEEENTGGKQDHSILLLLFLPLRGHLHASLPPFGITEQCERS